MKINAQENLKPKKNNIASVFGNLNKKRKENKGKVKDFFSQLSRGLMLPIAILPIAGLLLGISGAIGANLKNEGGMIAANILNAMSSVVFNILPLLFSVALTITFSKDRGASGFCSVLAYLVFCSFQLPFFQFDKTNTITSILWFHKDPEVIKSITTTTLGFTTLQTSIFGGIVVGLITSVIYNKVSKIKLPTALDFFSGIRLVPIVLIPLISLVALVFLIFWPWIGQLINIIGSGIQKAPYGTGGLLYGILGRSLQPFGLHHIPIILAFQTPFGGEISWNALNSALSANDIDMEKINVIHNSFGLNNQSISGDQNIWNFINGLPFNTLPIKLSDGSLQETPIFDWFTKTLNVYPGRYTQDYPTYIGVCMGIGAAIIFTSEKQNRKQVASIIGSSMVVSFLTEITEPLEYTFLFCAPLLYYIIYVPMSGFSYMFMELVGAHVGVGFARGFIDLVIYGAIPVLKGTKFYFAFVLAIAEGAITFLLFWLLIKKMNIQTPGRGSNNFKLIDKKTYQEMKDKNNKNKNEVDTKTIQIINALGGLENIENVTACATRLRVSLKSSNSLDVNKVKQLGSMGEVINNKSVQLIFGGEAAILSEKINDVIDSKIDISNINFENNNELIKNENVKSSEKKNNFIVYSPVDCQVITLDNVCDDAFKNKLLGDGVAIIPKSNEFYSIIEKGVLENCFDTKHCYIFKTDEGQNVMMHIGIDSVELNGIPFDVKIKEKEKVFLNKKITNVDLEKLSKSKSIQTPIVVCDMTKEMKIELLVKNNQNVKKGTPIYKVIYS